MTIKTMNDKIATDLRSAFACVVLDIATASTSTTPSEHVPRVPFSIMRQDD